MSERYVIKQRVHYVNNKSEWVEIASFSKEHEAWEAFDKAKLSAHKVGLFKITETLLTGE